VSRLVLVLAIFATAAPAQQPSLAFRSADCAVAFDHPSDWDVVRDTSDHHDRSRFSVRPRDWRQRLLANDSIDVYTIAVEIVTRGFESELSESAFRRRGRGWVVQGRLASPELDRPAIRVTGPGWTGLRGTATQGCYREGGSYAGLCDQPTALVGTSNRSVSIIGGAQSDSAFNRLLTTLRFEK
jgi:hypothetical protein